jgi:hypothetical protein
VWVVVVGRGLAEQEAEVVEVDILKDAILFDAILFLILVL